MKRSFTTFTAKQLQGRFDCFSHFNRSDIICLRYCAQSIRCAVAKRQWFDLEGTEEYYPSSIYPDFDPGLE
jgi:hypothetical protein